MDATLPRAVYIWPSTLRRKFLFPILAVGTPARQAMKECGQSKPQPTHIYFLA